MRPSTFSIVAFDQSNGDLGIAVESKFLGVGAVVPWARAGTGAIATQAWANTRYGPLGLDMLQQRMSPEQVGAALVAGDENAAQRQFAIVDAQGRAHSYTGSGCLAWAGGRTGVSYAVQGNILTGPEVVAAVAEEFESAAPRDAGAGYGDLAERLLTALAAGQAAGGDKRGQESAALLVVRAGAGYSGFNDRYIDLRVDDHPKPIEELRRLLDLHRLYLGKPDPEDLLAIDDNLARELQQVMARRGYSVAVTGVWDDQSKTAFREFAGVENLEERLQEGPFVDRVVLKFLRERFGAR